MKQCPQCGEKFNWWQRAIGEADQHIKECIKKYKHASGVPISTGCRGCPAGCYENVDYDKDPYAGDTGK